MVKVLTCDASMLKMRTKGASFQRCDNVHNAVDLLSMCPIYHSLKTGCLMKNAVTVRVLQESFVCQQRV